MSSRYASVANSVPKTLVAEAAAGAGCCSAVQAIFQFISFSTSAPACTRARWCCTHSWSITRRPSVSRVRCAQSRTSRSASCSGAAEVSATRSWLSWLVISGHPSFSVPTSADAGTRTSW